jgi:flagellar hook-associated protein 2
MAAIQLSGLVSGFDWKTFVDQMISIERAPATRMTNEISDNNDKIDALSGLDTMLGKLRDSITALNKDGVFDARKATVSGGTGWSATAATTASAGSYTFAVTQRATASKLTSGSDIGRPISTSDDVSGVTLASFGSATALTAGVFTVNGSRVTVALTDSLQDLFDKISAATGNAVTAAYNSGTDKITLTGASPIVLGSATDTSNFLAVSRLSNNNSGSVTSGGALGSASTTATLANARLATPVTAVDGSGNGSFVLNGVTIAYNTGTDTLAGVVSRINASTAGVTAAYDPSSDKITLQNKATGDLGFSISETSGGLMGALGLTSGASLSRGLNAQFTVNGGATLASTGNTLTADVHGITGLSLDVSGADGSATVGVSSDTGSARSLIDSFITSFNSVQSYIDLQSKITSSKGKVSTSVLSDNREVQSWAGQLRKAVFANVPGLSSTLSQLGQIGIDFTGLDANLTVKNPATLDAALRNRPDEVSALFRQSSTGIFARLGTLIDTYIGNELGSKGLLDTQKTNLTTGNTSLTDQIAALERRLVQRRAQLEAGFAAMETAQSKIKQMQSQITNTFSNKNKN